MRRIIAAAGALLLWPVLSQAAVISVMDFESLAVEGLNHHSLGRTYSEAGYTITQNSKTARQLAVYGKADPRFPGSTALFNDQPATSVDLTKDDGGLFTPISIDLSEITNGQLASATFEGWFEDGSKISQKFQLDGVFGMETFFFDEVFTDIVSLSWMQETFYPHQFDNITLRSGGVATVVPLPATLPMLFGALALLTPLALRRRG